MTTEVREAKKVLQDELLDLIVKFEKKFDVNVTSVSVLSSYVWGVAAGTVSVEVRVEV